MLILFSKFLASFFGLGYLPWMPGTWGTLGAVLCSLFFLNVSPYILLLTTITITFLGLYVSKVSLQATAYDNMDPSWIVIDEVAGYFWAISLISFVRPLDYQQLALAFIFFRIFDIMKPWPISWIDQSMAASQKTAALGIMLDDVLAGIFAALFTLLACRIIFS